MRKERMQKEIMPPAVNRENGINLTNLRETVQAIQKDPSLGLCKFRAKNKWIDANHNCSTILDFYAAKQENKHSKTFEIHADEPKMLAGQDAAANPVEHLLNALASCITTSMVAHAAVQGIHIDELESQLEGDINLNGYLGLDANVPKGYTDIRVTFKVKTDEKNLDKLKQLATFSPVYNTLLDGANVEIKVERK